MQEQLTWPDRDATLERLPARNGAHDYLKTKVQRECLYVQRGERWVKPD